MVILTPMNLEYQAMRAEMRELSVRRHPAGTTAEVGTVPGVPWPVALVVTGEGTLMTAVVAQQVVDWLRPRALFVVGVAGGLKDDVELGDVVVGTWVYGVHAGKEDVTGFQPRPRAWEGAFSLVQAARAVDNEGSWSAPGGGRPKVHFKPIAVGDVVLNSRVTPLAAQLKRNYSDAVAIETESSGAATAAHVSAPLLVLAVRGISDKADGRKHVSDAEGLQPVAAAHAAAFLAALLRELAETELAKTELAEAELAEAELAKTELAKTEPAVPGAAMTGPDLAADEAPLGGEGPGRGPEWRSLGETLPTAWLPQLGAPLLRASAFLELHLVPAGRAGPLAARQLGALSHELTALGRAGCLFGPDETLSASDPATVVSTAGNGLAVTRDGQRSAWMPLPKDTLGAVLDPADIADRVSTLLRVLLQIEAPCPAEAGLAVGVTPAILLAEGDVSALPRKLARGRTSMTPVRVPAADVLARARITACPQDVAAELTARLFLAFHAQLAGGAAY
jgi:nucleoside phosphorylase